MNENQSHTRSLRIVPFVNNTGEDIPAHGLIELEGSEDEGFIAFKPRTDNCYCYVSISEVSIPEGKNGQASSGEQVVIATDGDAAAGELWGAQVDSFLAKLDNTGFRAMADGSDGVVFADRPGSNITIDKFELIDVTSRDADAYGWPATLYINNHDGTWTTSVEIRVNLTPDGYDRFEAGDIWAQRNGKPKRTITDAVTTEDSDAITSATGVFTALDVGAVASGPGIPAGTTIVSVESPTDATLSAEATADGTDITITLTLDMPQYFAPGNFEGPIADCDTTDPDAPINGYRLWSIPGPVHFGDFIEGDPP